MAGQEWHDSACAMARTRTAASREVDVSGAVPAAATVEEQQPQKESSLLPLDNTLMNVMETTTRHYETEMVVQPAANIQKSTAGSVIFQEGGRRISGLVPQNPVQPPDSSRREKSKRGWPHTEVVPDQIG